MRFIVRAINNTNNIKQRLCILLWFGGFKVQLLKIKTTILISIPTGKVAESSPVRRSPWIGVRPFAQRPDSAETCVTTLRRSAPSCLAVWLVGILGSSWKVPKRGISHRSPFSGPVLDLPMALDYMYDIIRYYKHLHQRWLRQRAEFLGSILILCRPSSNIQKHLSVHKYWQMPTYRPERHSIHQLDRIWYNSYFWIPGRTVEVWGTPNIPTSCLVLAYAPTSGCTFCNGLACLFLASSFQTLQKLQYLRFFCSFWAYFPATCGSPLTPGASISIKMQLLVSFELLLWAICCLFNGDVKR